MGISGWEIPEGSEKSFNWKTTIFSIFPSNEIPGTLFGIGERRKLTFSPGQAGAILILLVNKNVLCYKFFNSFFLTFLWNDVF